MSRRSAERRSAYGAKARDRAAWSLQPNNLRPISTSRRLRQGRGAEEAHLVHARRAARLSASAPTSRCPASIPTPGTRSSSTQAGGILGMFNMFAGGGIHRMAIFALNIMPYISASIIIQLMTTVSPTLEALKKEGEQGRKVINQYTRYLHRGAGGVPGLRHRHRPRRRAAASSADPGWFFRISTAITLTGGTMFLMWLGEQITARGIGNGISLIIFAGIVAELPSAHRRHARTRPPGRAVDRPDPGRHRDGGRRDRLHRVHGARAAPAADPVSEAPGRQPDVRGPVLAPAAQAQHLGRHPADLRLVAAAAADHGRELQRRPAARTGSQRLTHAARPRPAAVPAPLCRR